MTIFLIQKYAVKSEKQGEFMPLMQRQNKFIKENPVKFKEVKSWKLFTQVFGGIASGYVEMWELDNIADVEKLMTRISKDEGWTKIHQEAMLVIEPATFSMNVWNAVM